MPGLQAAYIRDGKHRDSMRPRAASWKIKQLARAAHQIADVQAVIARGELLDHAIALANRDRRFGKVERVEWKAKDFSARGVFPGEQVEGVVAAKLHALDAVIEARELLPFAGSVPQIMGKVAAIAVGHGGQGPLAVVAGFQFDFSDAREVLADFIFVVSGRRAESMKPDLLVEVDIRLRPLA